MNSLSFSLTFMVAMFLLTGWSWWACTSLNASDSQRNIGEFIIGTSWPLSLMLKAKRAADQITDKKNVNQGAVDEANR